MSSVHLTQNFKVNFGFVDNKCKEKYNHKVWTQEKENYNSKHVELSSGKKISNLKK